MATPKGFCARLNARLKGFRLILVSLLLAMPEVLEGLAGFEWADVLPEAWQGYSAKIGGALAIVRLAVIPAWRSARGRRRRKRRGDPCDGDSHDA